ncbi:hypothetical protein RCO28_22175 [Streptomyces sp. LHD-70]|uniref:hypothetical protein n=1 Tax=Streptomyces sp. LHD-70 TaxID=3072140 RepID=UPI00280D4F08|nr:hypothetical protein [Streptomyces sp. LHD-70]MDQ8705182.1 hypothetical protein [Streptomyces sp. LHD-70]
MTHIEADALIAVALGESPRAADHRHLSRCAACSKHLAALVRIVEAARSSTPADIPQPPPERLWHAIEHAIRRGGASGGPPDHE